MREVLQSAWRSVVQFVQREVLWSAERSVGQEVLISRHHCRARKVWIQLRPLKRRWIKMDHLLGEPLGAVVGSNQRVKGWTEGHPGVDERGLLKRDEVMNGSGDLRVTIVFGIDGVPCLVPDRKDESMAATNGPRKDVLRDKPSEGIHSKEVRLERRHRAHHMAPKARRSRWRTIPETATWYRCEERQTKRSSGTWGSGGR